MSGAQAGASTGFAPFSLSVRSLALRAGGHGRELFSGLSFDVAPGQRWVVLGPNGAGKSTLLATLAGLQAAAGGTIELQGRPLARWSPEALADWRAWCPQFWVDPFAATVGETVRLARHRGDRWGLAGWLHTAAEDDAAVEAVLKQLDLASLVDADVRTLSGGERQRVAIATAVLQDAPLLLLDEPAAHLDLAHQQGLLALLRTHADCGGAVVMPVHDLNLAWDAATHAVLIGPHGQAHAGARGSVMTPWLLSAAFGVPIDRVEVNGRLRFWARHVDEVGG